MQPRLRRSRCAQQLPRQALRFRSRQQRIPHQVAAGGKALEGAIEGVDQCGVLVLELVGRVDEHDRAPGGRREQCLERCKAVAGGDLHAPSRAVEVRGQRACVGGVALEQAQRVFAAGQALGDLRGAGIDAGRLTRADDAGVTRQRRRHAGGAAEALDAARGFAVSRRQAAVQRVASGAGMGVDIPVRRGFTVEVIEHLNQHHMLENIGMVAGVVGVAIAEH